MPNPTRKRTDKPASRRDEYRKRRERERFFHFAMHKNEDKAYITYLQGRMETQSMREIMRDLIDATGEVV